MPQNPTNPPTHTSEDGSISLFVELLSKIFFPLYFVSVITVHSWTMHMNKEGYDIEK